jgi:hypothetical protein
VLRSETELHGSDAPKRVVIDLRRAELSTAKPARQS